MCVHWTSNFTGSQFSLYVRPLIPCLHHHHMFVISSGNQTWQWNIHRLQMVFPCVPVKPSIYTGFPNQPCLNTRESPQPAMEKRCNSPPERSLISRSSRHTWFEEKTRAKRRVFVGKCGVEDVGYPKVATYILCIYCAYKYVTDIDN